MINSKLPNGFWVKAMETANYLCNKLPIRSKNYGEMILEKTWTGQRQDLQYIQI